jgi:hypothetical protein
MTINTIRFQVDGSYRVELSDGRSRSSRGVTEEIQDWIDAGNTVEPYVAPEPSWLDKRLANMASGGYGTTGEQFEMIGEQGMDAYQAHIAKVKTDIPKGDS